MFQNNHHNNYGYSAFSDFGDLDKTTRSAKISTKLISFCAFSEFANFNKILLGIDLFSLYILFSHFRPRDATRGNSFFQMSSYARVNLRITNEKTKGKFP